MLDIFTYREDSCYFPVKWKRLSDYRIIEILVSDSVRMGAAIINTFGGILSVPVALDAERESRR